MASVSVSPSEVQALAARIDGVRAAVHPGALPVGFAPAGADPVSAATANRISAQAAQLVTGLWSTWTQLGVIAEKVRANAAGYERQDQEGAALLGGAAAVAGGLPVVPAAVLPEVAGPAVPHVYTATAAATPEQLAAALRSGAGAQSPEAFGQRWSAHAAQLDAAAGDLASVKGGLGSVWAGGAHDGADRTVGVVQADLVTHSGGASQMGRWAATHADDYRRAVDPDSGVPHPDKFAAWHQDLDNAVAADSQYPGVYTAAVVNAQEQLGQGYSQAGQAYGQYAIDPVTGEAIDPVTGEPVDPVTGEPLADSAADDGEGGPADGQELLSAGAGVLTGLLSGAVGAVGAAVGAIASGGQQLTQMASQGVGQLAKGIGQPDEPDLGLPDIPGGGDFGGGGGDFGGGSGGGGATAPAAVLGPSVGSASAPPGASAAPSPAGLAGGPRPAGAGLGGLGSGMPFMPMGGAAGGGGGSSKPEASPDGKKFVAPQRANTQKVIGEASTERLAAKRDRRQQRMNDAKTAATQEEEAT